jgi:ABC-2 type transport system permease protein
MRKTWLIFVNSLQRMRLILGASFLAGVIACVVTALLSSLAPSLNAPIMIGYIDNEKGVLAEDFKLYATERLGLELVEGGQDYLDNELVEKHISAIVEVPAGLGESLLKGHEGALQVTYMDDYLNKVFLQNYLELYMASVEMLAAASQGDADTFGDLLDDARSESAQIATAGLDEERIRHDKDWSSFLVGSGFFLFLAAMLVIVLATIIYEDRANQTFKRVQATNVHALSYVIGVCTAGFISIAAMVAVFLAYCVVSGLGAIIPLGAVTVLCLLYVLVCVAFALAAGLLFESRAAILWAVMAISTIFSLLGGAWFPITYAPEFLQQIAHVTPQFWVTDALSRMQTGDMQTWLTSAGILSLFSLLLFLVAGVQFASKSRSA